MDKPLTNNLTTDIVLLSSFLSNEGRHVNKESAEHKMLNHISTLLNVSNTGSVHTVVGDIDAEHIQCTIFTEKRSVIGQDSAKAGPRNCQRQSVIPDPKRGAGLLENWEHDKE